jgi:hypothetical protein
MARTPLAHRPVSGSSSGKRQLRGEVDEANLHYGELMLEQGRLVTS